MRDSTSDATPNALIHESSPYLRQHAYNPVDWQPWSEAVWEEARATDKLVIVSIGYSACHWCHVMEHETVEDSAAAAFMNEHFVSIKVDREERPDVDGVYMTAMPVDWADPDAVKENNWGKKNARKFEYWHKLNAYVRVRFDKLWDADWADIEYKTDWQSNFCIRTRRGELYLTRELDAEIWFHSSYEGRQRGEEPERFWSAKRGYEPKYAKKPTWKNTRGYAKKERWY